MTDDRIEVKVGASTGELKSGMDQAKSTVREGVQGIQTPFDQMRQNVTAGMKNMHSQVTGSLEGISTVLTGLGKIALGVGAILAGGAIFKGAIEEFVKINSESTRLSKIMNMNVGDAQALLESFKRVGVDGDTLTSMLSRMVKQLTANEEAFVRNKIAIRDTKGDLLPLNEILFNYIDRLKDVKAGTERAELASLGFGRNIANLPGFLKNSIPAMLAMKEQLASLGLTLDEVSGAKARAYKEGMYDVELVNRALKYKVGEELIPVLIQLARFFADVGPPAIKAFGVILSSAQSFLMGMTIITSNLRNGFSEAWDAIKIGGKVAKDVAHGIIWDFSEIAPAIAKGYADMEKSSASWRDQAVRDANAVRDSILSTMTATSGTKTGISIMEGKTGPGVQDKPKEDGDLFNPKTGTGGGGGGGGGANQVQVWKQELEEMKLAEKAFLESTLQDEMKFWRDKLALCREGSKEYTAVQHEVLMLSKQMARQEYQEKIADIKAQMADERKNSQERLALQDQELKLAARNYGLDSVQYKNSLREKNAMLLQFKNEQRQLEIADLQHQQAIYSIDAEMARADLNFKTQMGRMFEAEKIQGLKRIAQAEHAADKQALLDERAKYKESEKEYQQYTKRIELLDKKHLADMKKMDHDYTLALKAQFDQLWSGLTSSFTTALQGMINGTMTFGQAVSSIFTSLGQAIISMIAEVAMKYIANQLMMLIFGEASAKESALAGVSASAAEAGAAGFASVMAALPFPVNLAVAPEVGMAAAMKTMGFLSLASAAGGWDVPHDTLAMVHKDEKILPADWAEKLRAAAAPGGAAAGPTHLTLHLKNNVVTPDGRTILKENKTLLFKLTTQGIKHGEIRIAAPARR
jgi:hypothetical protein